MVGARADIALGKNSAAVSKLERGLRIESQNPELWHLLSKANYSDNNYQQSINMAKKSIRYSNDDNLIAQNWALIKKAGEKSAAIPGFQVRDQQQQMMIAVGEAIQKHSAAVIEAGTGVGKTFAYLVPALASGGRVIVSTGTKTLQDQLFAKDLPVGVRSLRGDLMTAEPSHILQRIADWEVMTFAGDIGELNSVPRDAEVWQQVTSTADNCLGTDCDEYDSCFVVKARREAQEADVVILDEAHQLPEVASTFFSETLSSRQLIEFGRDTLAEVLSGASDMTDLRDDLRELEKCVLDLRLAMDKPGLREPWYKIKSKPAIEKEIAHLGEILDSLYSQLKVAAERSKGLESCLERIEVQVERLRNLNDPKANTVQCYRALNEAAELLRGEIDYPIMVQGDSSQGDMIENFRKLGNAVLLGTSSFWEGVDVLEARIKSIREAGGNPFFEYQLPQAVIALKQGVGRLIRDDNDTGLLMICDPRLRTKSYGNTFLESMPRVPRTTIETATEACSAALIMQQGSSIDDEQKVVSEFKLAPREHTKLILPMIEKVLKVGGCEMSEIDAIAFGRGPGAFTGLRIAAGIAQGLALSIDKPVIPVSTLSSLAVQASQENYDGETIIAGMDKVREYIEDNATNNFIGIGSAWDAYPVEDTPHLATKRLRDIRNAFPAAADLAKLAMKDYIEEKAVSIEQAQPVYIRNNVAENSNKSKLMKIKFYGVRGSIATPGPSTIRYGGNTACVSVKANDGSLFVLDAGTGIKVLGDEIMEKSSKDDIHLFFSHYHWDHIQGFPFFLPAYQPDQTIHLLAAHMQDEQTHTVLTQMTDPHFPVPSDRLEAKVKVLSVIDGSLAIGNTLVKTKSLNHPGGGSAYRLEMPEGSMAYVTDNEIFPPGEPSTSYEEWVEFLQDVDYLIHDAMYLDDELQKIHGWGHSLISQTLQLAVDANVSNLILFHHDPSRTDDQLDQILLESKTWMNAQNPDCSVFMAKEGDEYAIMEGVNAARVAVA
ncbi:putative ATP-dependent DNA helicase YoaA [Nymphon striatum]|nr:putative ATP-dependent DNA helicase YoaA [Nymphon striatum]